MKIKTILSLLAVASALVAEAAPSGLVPPNPSDMLSPEKKAELKAKKEARIAKMGGFIELPSTGNVIRVVNKQKILPEATLKQQTELLGQLLRMPIVFGDTPKAGITITVSGDGETPSILVAPEEGWAVINLGTLSKDKPSNELLAERFGKEFWRATAMAIGGYVSMFQPCLMQVITDVRQLDAIHLNGPSPEVLSKMVNGAHAFGIRERHRVSYRKACQEGWAPAPTNDMQKAVWDQVKADKERGPTNPITIKPPKK